MNNSVLSVIYFLLWIVMSLISFILFGIDKKKAKKSKIRIHEKTLLFFSVLGSIGSFFGRKVFHHKTDKIYFSVVIYSALFFQTAELFFLIYMK